MPRKLKAAAGGQSSIPLRFEIRDQITVLGYNSVRIRVQRNNNGLGFPRLASCKLLRSFPAAFPPSVQGSHVDARDVPLPPSHFSRNHGLSLVVRLNSSPAGR